MEKYKRFIIEAFHNAENNISKINDEIIKMEGLSGTKTRHFYNNLLQMTDARYLEIGTYKGSSVCSAMFNNRAKVICIDNWSEFGGPRSEFIINFEQYKGQNEATFIDSDCFTVDVSLLPQCNIFMYDGNHSLESHYKALIHFYNCLDDIFIFIVDDWNWSDVRNGTIQSIHKLNLTILFEKEIRLTMDNSCTHQRDGWWNGIYVAILQKPHNTKYNHIDLLNLYHKKVQKDAAYFKKYEILDDHKDGKIENWWSGKDYPRIPCILDFKEWVVKYNIEPTKLLYTCESDFELNYVFPRSKYLLTYDPNNGSGDLHTFCLNETDFDFCLFSQTIEHLYNPLKALEQINKHLRKGAHVFTSVPSINIPHSTPIHFSGIYPMGLAVLFEISGFEILEMGQWGNSNYINYIFTHHEWPDCEYIQSAGNGFITNEEKNVCQCWCLAKKI